MLPGIKIIGTYLSISLLPASEQLRLVSPLLLERRVVGGTDFGLQLRVNRVGRCQVNSRSYGGHIPKSRLMSSNCRVPVVAGIDLLLNRFTSCLCIFGGRHSLSRLPTCSFENHRATSRRVMTAHHYVAQMMCSCPATNSYLFRLPT